MVSMPVDKGFVVTSPMGPRWGQYHFGVDYGVAGGSGGKPIYAIKDGTVIAAGPASGFGQWIRVDHPASVGGNESVYGHIIPEVQAGQQVREGQRIGRINPNSATNGGVAPHLHIEVYRYSWVAPARRVLGQTILDPQEVLRGARWPGETQPGGAVARPVGKQGRTIYGIDISEHNDGLSCARAKQEGVDFAIIRVSDGTYVDPVFHSHLADAEQAGMLISTYWYLRAPSEGTTIAQQVDVIEQQMGGRRDLPVWIDVESVDNRFPPSDPRHYLLRGEDVWEAKRELERRGYHVPGVYTGAWYWERMPGGEPSMQGLGALWCSNYGLYNGVGDPRVLYTREGGDRHPGWDYPLGDRKPDLLQYGSRGTVAGRPNVDVNAYRGSREQLEALFTGHTPKEELSMADIQRILDHIDRKTEETKRYVDIRITGPMGSDVKDIRQQLTGGRDKIIREDGTVDIEASYPGWEQLGQDSQGRNLTLADAVASVRRQLVEIQADVDELKRRKK
ncbi:peptidoglycan DD-metalloendopeptidase family protein [Corynebacterium simulans]|uniref:Glycosyl hydrolases 25 family protein n=1 Tax=Corynebacterium simulans TaxID=146827 RepID=A0ABR5VAD6_9CORY|nr:peptidoglycan DD-metalloendopeptidase family protein [Corynebacterium simulans]KXU18457.1 glycosyl hydrolases 25 family protein [Corynebacterium simulans]